ncbi:metalloregulator ArsR/SmtB family transcription factor [Ornithinimicrobium sp. Arc0846-15]|nr:metalloregulator ArsR/SmtB family transcription factor [Ornithinimicrobium laminariae]
MTDLVSTEADCRPTSTNAMGTEQAGALAAVLKALADPFRLRMLSAIASDPRGESCVCDLAELAEVSQPTVSHHLKVLKDAGVLTAQRRGTWVWYQVSPSHREGVTFLLSTFAAQALRSSAPAGPANRDLDAQISRLAEDLASSHPSLPRETVVGLVRESYASLVSSARITTHLIPLTERFAKQRLADITKDRQSPQPQVLFVCVANAGRSQLAAALTRHLSGGLVIARSAGSSPAADLHPHVRELIDEIDGVKAQETFPKPLTDDAIRASDVVITMGCGDVCPVIPGVRYEDWAVGDPALASREGVIAIRDDIQARVEYLLNTLKPTS